MKGTESSMAIIRNTMCQHLKRALLSLSPRPSTPTHRKGMKKKSDLQSMGEKTTCGGLKKCFYFSGKA
jgi:hypothetical protein